MITPGNRIIWAIFLLLTALEREEIPVREITGRMDMERVIFKQILERVFGVRDSARNLTRVPSEKAVLPRHHRRPPVPHLGSRGVQVTRFK